MQPLRARAIQDAAPDHGRLACLLAGEFAQSSRYSLVYAWAVRDAEDVALAHLVFELRARCAAGVAATEQ